MKIIFNKKITRVNLNWWPVLHCESDQIFSNIKRGCLGNDSVFFLKKIRKI
jgi:hypothetical protein